MREVDELVQLCVPGVARDDAEEQFGLENGFQNAVAGAEEAIVITTPEMSAVRDADRIVGLLEVRKDEIQQYRLVINRIRPQMVRNSDMMSVEDVLGILSVKLLGVVPKDEEIIISTKKKRTCGRN